MHVLRPTFELKHNAALQHLILITPKTGARMLRNCLNATLRFLKEEDGPTTVEYAVVLSLILGAIIVSVNQLSAVVGNSFNASGNAINSAIGN